MPLRVFVSHSSQENASVLKALAEAFQRRPRDFTLLMDTEELKPGDAWRARVNLWLGACDAAVLVLSKHALDKPWVMYEAAILSYRNRGGAFRIIPVLLDDPEAKLLKDRRLDAPHIGEIQVVHGDKDPAKTAKAVVKALENYVAPGTRPIDDAVSRVLTILHGLPSHLLADASAFLKLQLPWEPGAEPLVPFAEKLLSAPVDDAIDALLAVREHIANDAKKVEKLVHLVAASWVDPKAVTELPEIWRATARRAVALNAVFAETARMYQVAATAKNTWHFVSCGDVNPEARLSTAEEVLERVDTALRERLTVPPGKDVRAALKAADRHIVLVAIPAIGLTDVVIERLQTEYPTVAFFFLAGEESLPAAVLERKLLTLIIPQLNENEEATFKTNHDRLVANVHTTLGW